MNPPPHLAGVLEELVEVLPRRPRPQSEAVLNRVLGAADGRLAVRRQRNADFCVTENYRLAFFTHRFEAIAEPTWPWWLLRPLPGKVLQPQALSKIVLGKIVAVVDVKSETTSHP